MKAWLENVYRDLAVALGLIEPPQLQRIPVRAQRDKPAPRRR